MAIRNPLFFTADDGSLIIGNNDYSAQVKNISVEFGERATDFIRTMGNNSYLINRPQNKPNMTFTAISSGNRLGILLLGGSPGGASPLAYEGSPVAGDGSYFPFLATLLVAEPGAAGAAHKITFSGAYLTNFSMDLRGASEGQLEETVTIEGRPSQFFYTYTGNRTAVPLK